MQICPDLLQKIPQAFIFLLQCLQRMTILHAGRILMFHLDLRLCLIKRLVQQRSFALAAICCFFFLLSG